MSSVIQDENGRVIPNILRDGNGAIIVNDNSAFYRAAAEADRVKNEANKIAQLDVTVKTLTSEMSEIKQLLQLLVSK
jgi:hypothetical protein